MKIKISSYEFRFLVECRYDDVAFTDCDPIKLTRWRQLHLIAGGPACEKIKNETKGCDVGDFPPGKNDCFFDEKYSLICASKYDISYSFLLIKV